jgi:hypothetical protein
MVEPDARCVCGHMEIFHFLESAGCLYEVKQWDGKPGKICPCAEFRPTLPHEENVG